VTAGPFGAAIGGMVGAMLGGLMGYIGGQKISQFFDDFGVWVTDTFSNGLLVIKNFFLDMWGTVKEIFLDIGDTIDSIKISVLDWLIKQAIKLMEADPTGLAVKTLNPLTQEMQEQEYGLIKKMGDRKVAREEIAREKEARQIEFQNTIDKQQLEAEDRMKKREELQENATQNKVAVVSKTSADAIDVNRSASPMKQSQQEFYDNMYATLLAEAKKAGVKNPEVVARLGAAQSSLETGYGKSTAAGNNYFGIKDFSKKNKGIATKEFINGKYVTIKDSFRSYDNMQDSAADYIKFLQTNKRYAGVLNANNIQEAITAQAATGYATDPKYGAKLTQITNKGMSTRPQISGSRTQLPSPPIMPASLTANQISPPIQSIYSSAGKTVADLSKQQVAEQRISPVIVNQNIDASSVQSTGSTEKPQASGGCAQPDTRGLSSMVACQ
jgi:flagellum-specific peptidoglycan hydrolase FlgJ